MNGEDDARMVAGSRAFPDICFHEISLERKVIFAERGDADPKSKGYLQ